MCHLSRPLKVEEPDVELLAFLVFVEFVLEPTEISDVNRFHACTPTLAGRL
jgi:hypothetical protein